MQTSLTLRGKKPINQKKKSVKEIIECMYHCWENN
jgi:hypothetical protein